MHFSLKQTQWLIKSKKKKYIFVVNAAHVVKTVIRALNFVVFFIYERI